MQMTALDVLREFVTDIEAVYGENLSRSLVDDWPDLHATYEKAKAVIAAETH